MGLHSSDPVTVHLSLFARVADFAPSDLEAALYERKSLVRMLGMRRTMFVVSLDVAAIMDEACTKAIASRERRRLEKLLEDQGITKHAEPWLDDVCERTLAALRGRGEAAAVELTEDIPELGNKIVVGEGRTWAGQMGVSTRVLFLLAAEGRIVRTRPRGSWISGQYRWAELETWLGAPLPRIDHDEACAELARRWLRAFGPGTTTDLKWWTGWTVKQTKASLDAVGAVEVDLGDGATGWVLPDDLERTRVARPLGSAAARLGRDGHGLEGARLVPRPARTAAVRSQRQRGADDLGGRARSGRLDADSGRPHRDEAPRGDRYAVAEAPTTGVRAPRGVVRRRARRSRGSDHRSIASCEAPDAGDTADQRGPRRAAVERLA